jgi:alpha-L-fucosidase/beta-galactosidase GanA
MNHMISLFLAFLSICASAQTPIHTFALGDSDFLLDGHPLQMISGEMHYTRVPREYWRVRMKMAKAMGLNTIGTYVFWNAHEEEKGKYDFTGNNDIAAFVQTAKEEGLWVVLRPSPYVCAEWEFGGYPAWLLKDSTVKVRSTDPRFIDAYRTYINRLARQLVPLLVTHGGNILMVQFENEYGSYSDDKTYLDLNRQLFRDAGFDGILYTCDGPTQMPKGYLPGYLPAVNGEENPTAIKELINKYHDGKGPYYLAEWYPGWFDNWGKPHAHTNAQEAAATLDKILGAGISINMYMFHGGSTRGFMNGANMGRRDPYAPQTASYDYDAPLDEAGNATEKFYTFRKVIEKHLPPGQTLPPVPVKKSAVALTPIRLTSYAGLFENLPTPITAAQPLCFEELNQAYGFILYRTQIKGNKSGWLKIKELRDYAIVYINGRQLATLDRRLNQDSVKLDAIPGSTVLDILVENNGRINYGPYLTDNRQGITKAVTLNGQELTNWKMYRFPFSTTEHFKFSSQSVKDHPALSKGSLPALYKGSFSLEELHDTYLDLRGFGKGFVFLNGHNLGKYWQIGPQQTLYAPACWLKKGTNQVIVFDELKDGHTTLKTRSTPILNEATAAHTLAVAAATARTPALAPPVTPPKPFGVLPTPTQLAWHETEMYCLIHFGVDTYTDKEWGYGDEDPALVNPVGFDAMQIVGAAKAGGFKGVVIVAKHHDGLCLWPTATTGHNISKSPWRNGKGDFLKEYQQACNKLGMRLGVYCSPWDRNNPRYGTPAYVQTYRAQLKELYTNYGPLFMSWHDGANGGDGYYGGARETRKIDRTTYYGWDSTWAITRQLQPGAAIFGDVGPDVRWVGNEEGHAGTTCWATYTPRAPDPGKKPANGYSKYEEATQGTRNGEYWLPAECDVPLRPGWFYHASQDGKVKSPYQLLDLYYQSVGRGAALDLGLAPDRRGLLNEHDVASLKGFGDLLQKTFSTNLAKDASFTASNIRGKENQKYGPARLVDNDRYSYWATDDSVTEPQLIVDLHQPTIFNVIRLRENIKLGQRIDSFTIDAWQDGQWRPIASATSIGANRLIRLPQNVTTAKIRLSITGAGACIALSDLGLFKEPPHPAASPISNTNRISGLSKKGWRIINPYSSGNPASLTDRNPPANAIDDNPATLWSTLQQDSSSPGRFPRDITIDMGQPQTIKAFTYLPRQDQHPDGIVDRYIFYTSNNGADWQKAAEGEFSNIKSNPLQQLIPLTHPVSTRYFKFSILHVVAGNGVTVAELGAISNP